MERLTEFGSNTVEFYPERGGPPITFQFLGEWGGVPDSDYAVTMLTVFSNDYYMANVSGTPHYPYQLINLLHDFGIPPDLMGYVIMMIIVCYIGQHNKGDFNIYKILINHRDMIHRHLQAEDCSTQAGVYRAFSEIFKELKADFNTPERTQIMNPESPGAGGAAAAPQSSVTPPRGERLAERTESAKKRAGMFAAAVHAAHEGAMGGGRGRSRRRSRKGRGQYKKRRKSKKRKSKRKSKRRKSKKRN